MKIFGDFLFYMYICKIYYELYLISLGILTLLYMFVFSGDFLLMLTVDRLGIKIQNDETKKENAFGHTGL